MPGSGASTTSHTFTGLTNGTSYRFRVRAVNATGDGAASPESDAVTAAAVPPAPATPAAVRGYQSILLTWSSNGNGGEAITGWKYQQKAGENAWGDWTEVPGSSASTTSYTVTGLTNGTSYRFKVRAVNALGDGAASPESDPVIPAVVPPAPGKLAASPGNQSVTLTWFSRGNGGSAITGWDYQQKNGDRPWGAWTEVPNSGASTTSHTVTGLINGVTHRFRVRAVNAVGDGAASPESDPVTPATTPPAPGKPATSPVTRSVALTWSPTGNGGSPITGWKYQQKAGANAWGDWTEVPGSGASTTSHTVTGLTNGTSYRFKIRAVNAVGDGAESAQSDAVTPVAATLTLTRLGGSSAATTLGNHTGDWYYNAVSWTDYTVLVGCTKAGGNTVTVTGMTAGHEYQITAFADTYCLDRDPLDSASARFTASAVDLNVTSITYTSASVGIDSHTGDWWYEVNPNGASCTKATGTTASVTGLSPSTAYTAAAYTNNACGNWLAAKGFTTLALTAPPAPSKPAASRGNESATLTWSSTGDGGSAITGWDYQHKKGRGGQWGAWSEVPDSSATSTTHIVTGLTNGAFYRFRVRAVNAIGDGAASAQSNAVIPAATPPAPGKPAVSRGARSVTLTWSSTGDSGQGITGWEYQYKAGADPWGAWTEMDGSGASTTSHTVTGLTEGVTYRFKIRAVNDVGDGAASPESDAVMPAVAPPAPSKPTVSRGDGSVTLTWSSTGDGGSAITGWEYQVGQRDWGDWTEVPDSGASTTSHTVTGLTNGASYRFRVRAVNAVGDGAASAESDPVTPAATPPAPTRPAVSRGNRSVTLTWSSTGDGGLDITGWEYQQKEGENAWGDWTEVPDSGASTTSHTVTGLTNGASYRFRVRAVNALGDGAASDESAAVTPATTLAPPLAPTRPAVSPGDRSVTLTWLSSGDGGSPITRWQYVKKEGDGAFETTWTNVPGSDAGTTAHTVTGLTNGVAYRFKVRAVNAVGDGAASDESAAVTPATTPPAPTRPAVSRGNRSVTLTWRSTGNGGSGITGWEYQQKDGENAWGDWTEVPGSGASTTSHTVVGLTNGASYRFRVRAVNAVGDGAASAESAAVTPATTLAPPLAPTRPAVSPGDRSVTLTWLSSGDGGSPITRWQYVKKEGDGAFETTWTDVPGSDAGTTAHTVTGLTNGASYRFRVRAVNAVGDGAVSAASDAATPGTPPPAPGRPAASPGDRSVTLTWRSTGDGGSPIVKWQYVKKEGGGAFETTWTDVPGSGASTTTYTVPGLTNGTEYRFKVRAVNALGEGAPSPESAPITPAAATTGSGRLARVNKAIAPELARAMTSGVVEAVGVRLGHAVSRGRASAPALESVALALAGQSEALEEGTLTWREALGGAAFVHPLAADGESGGAGTAVWGMADYQRLSGGGDAGLPWEGEVGGVHLGLDTRLGDDLLGGLSLSMTEGSFDYTDRTGGAEVRGTYETSLTSVNPYAAWLLGDGSHVWAVLGRGAGKVEIDDAETGRQSGDSVMTSAVVGGELLMLSSADPAAGRSSRLAVKADAGVSRFEVESNGDRLGGIEVDVQRLRLALKGEGRFEPGVAGASLEPSVEVGMRWDGGDGETGLGLEAGGGIGYVAPGSGLRLEVRGRTLLAHEGDVEEWGVSGTVRVEPGAGGRGASFVMGLSRGDAGSGVERLWEDGFAKRSGSAGAEAGSGMRLDAEGGYGMAGPVGGLLTPYAGLGLAGGGEEERIYRLGARLTHGPASELDLEGSRREGGVRAPEHALSLEWRLRW